MIITKKPILISTGTVILLSVFKYERERGESIIPFDNCLAQDVINVPSEASVSNIAIIAEEGAEEFVKQLRGKWTPRFMRCLAKEIEKELSKQGYNN